MKPSMLALLALLVLVVSGAWEVSNMLGSSSSAGNVYGGADIAITVGEPASTLPVTGAQFGMLVGAGLLLVALGWALLEYRRRQQERAERIERGRRFRTPSP